MKTVLFLLAMITIFAGCTKEKEYTLEQRIQDKIIIQMDNLAKHAFRFRLRQATNGDAYLGYLGYEIEKNAFPEFPKATLIAGTSPREWMYDGDFYTAEVGPNGIFFEGKSPGFGSVRAFCDSTGRLSCFTFNGKFTNQTGTNE